MGEEKQVQEKPESQLKKEPREGDLAKRDAERQSKTDNRREQSRRGSSPESTTVNRSSEGRPVKMSWHS